MDIERKLKALDRIYAVYDEFVRTRETACTLRCTTCCTTHVTVTTLEAIKIREAVFPGVWEKLCGRLTDHAEARRFRPKVTTNALADICAEDGEPPPENAVAEHTSCPLLLDELCSIYALRPFNCRCFISCRPCAETGCADVEEFVLSVNTVFLQTIEHVDAEGCSGNLLDVLGVLAIEAKRRAYAEGSLHCTANGLIANRPMQVLMLPPEHRERVEPILSQLRAIRI